jgi:hypothetical protein
VHSIALAGVSSFTSSILPHLFISNLGPLERLADLQIDRLEGHRDDLRVSAYACLDNDTIFVIIVMRYIHANDMMDANTTIYLLVCAFLASLSGCDSCA